MEDMIEEEDYYSRIVDICFVNNGCSICGYKFVYGKESDFGIL